MVIHSTNNEHQAESLWDKCEGGALVWFWMLEADQEIGAEVASIHQ